MPQWVTLVWPSLSEFVQQNRSAFLIDFLLTALLAYPLYTYWRYGSLQKAAEIISSLGKSAKQTYLRTFQKIEVTEEQAPARFEVYYYCWYGRKRLLLPIVLVTLVAGSENFVLGYALLKLDLFSASIGVLAASIAGAYTFVTWSFFASVQRRSLLIADIMRGALRLAIAVPLGFALAGLSETAGPFLAFAVGVFPLDTISTILRQLANKKLSLELGAAGASSQISQLSGVDAATADRIADADITTIAQLAWCDPIDLTMRTNLRFGYVIDIVGQALTGVYLEGKLDVLRTFGLRGAFEIRDFVCKELENADATKKAAAQAVLAAAAQATSIPAEGLLYAFNQIAYDKSTKFLYEAE